jgi:hypothetical protein
LTGSLVVPVLMYGDDSVVGFDPDGIERLIGSARAAAAT